MIRNFFLLEILWYLIIFRPFFSFSSHWMTRTFLDFFVLIGILDDCGVLRLFDKTGQKKIFSRSFSFHLVHKLNHIYLVYNLNHFYLVYNLGKANLRLREGWRLRHPDWRRRRTRRRTRSWAQWKGPRFGPKFERFFGKGWPWNKKFQNNQNLTIFWQEKHLNE